MRSFRAFMYRKKMMIKGMAVMLAVATFTVISLVSCAGITKPCVGCERKPSSDPFLSAEEVRWSDQETENDREKRDRKRRRMYDREGFGR